MTLQPFLCEISEDRLSVTMRRGSWSNTVAATEMRKWLDLYRSFITRRPASERFYGECVRAIEKAMRDLGMPTDQHAQRKAKR